jgi:plasmid maintenance system antidote protein VapI
MALRLSRAFMTTPEVWIDLQKDYELWHAATGSDGWKKVKTVELKRSA